MKTEKYLNYEPPRVEVIEVEIEKGFASSIEGYGTNSDDSEFGDGYDPYFGW